MKKWIWILLVKWFKRKIREKILKVVKYLGEYAKEKRIKYDFIIIRASQFNSGFGKPDFSATNIVFPMIDGKEQIAKVGDIVSSLKAREKDRDNFFYLFYKRDGENTAEIDSQELCKILMREFF